MDETTLAAARLPDKFGISREKPRSNTAQQQGDEPTRKDFEPHPDFVLQTSTGFP